MPTICHDIPLNVPNSAYEKMPLSIDSDDPLLNVGKKELVAALRTPSGQSWVADWLFMNNQNPFHAATASLPPEAFDNSLSMNIRSDIFTTAPSLPTPRITFEQQLAATAGRNPILSKDMDMLIVPVARVHQTTVGYAFLRYREVANQSCHVPTPSLGDGKALPSFVTARFSFEHERSDFLLVVSGVPGPLIGIISMRRIDEISRDKSFFVVPRAEYSADYLPNRVLSIQCNVDYVVPPESSRSQPPTSNNPFSPTPPSMPTPPPAASPQPTTDSSQQVRSPSATCSESSSPCVSASNAPPSSKDPYAVESTPPHSPLLEAQWFSDAGISTMDTSGLDSLGTVITPDDPDALLPDFLRDYLEPQLNAAQMDVDALVDQVLEDAPPDPLASLPVETDTLPFEESCDTAVADVHAVVDATQQSTSSRAHSTTTTDGSWLFSSGSVTPDGVGVPRRPGASDTSAGSFDLSALTESLRIMEESFSGSFFGPRVRKDVMHPQTGELMSRCSGEAAAKVLVHDAAASQLFRNAAAQSYYSVTLPVSPDVKFMTTSMAVLPGTEPQIMSGTTEGEQNPAVNKQTAQQMAVDLGKRASFATLAPRPGPEPVRVMSVDTVASTPSADATNREAKIEAKRIRNRLSAAKSNQKRRALLDAQKKELAALRSKVEQLISRKTIIKLENDRLREQILSRS